MNDHRTGDGDIQSGADGAPAAGLLVSDLCLCLCLWLAAPGSLSAQAPSDYRASVDRWRTEHEAGLASEDGWLSVAGLWWLQDGANTMGRAATNAIVLPDGPERAGVIKFQAPVVRLRVEPRVEVRVSGQPVSPGIDLELQPDTSAVPSLVQIGRLRLTVIERSGRFGIRLKDPEARSRKEFQGLRWYPVRESHRVAARFEPYDSPRELMIANVIGQRTPLPTPGEVVFTLEGREVRLVPVLEEPGAAELFFMFKDATSSRTTYGAGRFLYSELPKDGTVVLDFNRAYNPPCAFTPFATCPLPPESNRLEIEIQAGEKLEDHH